jgi:hypothetical protein
MKVRNEAVILFAVGLGTMILVGCRDACRKGEQPSPEMAVLFDAAEAEFNALSPLLSLDMEEKAKSTIRGRLVFCAMLMKNCADRGVVVTRERPSDGFEQRTVTAAMIQKYVDQASKYPEWNDRDALMTGVLFKASG